MSYEGREQHICKTGHFWVIPVPYWRDDGEKCPFCNAESVFCNSVDDTNFHGDGEIPPELLHSLQITGPEGGTCNLGHYHVTKEPTYRVPTEEELKKLRHSR